MIGDYHPISIGVQLSLMDSHGPSLDRESHLYINSLGLCLWGELLYALAPRTKV
jgi:hypothetical protein